MPVPPNGLVGHYDAAGLTRFNSKTFRLPLLSLSPDLFVTLSDRSWSRDFIESAAAGVVTEENVKRKSRGTGRGSRERGFALIATALGLIAIVGIAGISVDVGRMYIAKNELMAYTDAASIAAGLELDGTS